MGIFSWLWPFGKKKEEVEKPEYMDEYVSRYRRLEEIKSTGPHVPSVKQLYAAETATERALRLDKERREARIDELSKVRARSRGGSDYQSNNSSISDHVASGLAGAAIGYAVGSMMSDNSSSSSNYESSYSGGDYSGGGSSDSWSDSGGGDCGGGCDGGGGD